MAKDKYWCSNHACKFKVYCQRFINDDNPLNFIDSLDNGANNYLYPFKAGIMKRPFSPDRDGYCKNFIEKPDSDRLSGIMG